MSGEDQGFPMNAQQIIDDADQERDEEEQEFNRALQIQKLQKRARKLSPMKGIAQLKASRHSTIHLLDKADTDPRRILRHPLPSNPQVQGLPEALADRYLSDYLLKLVARENALKHYEEHTGNATYSDEAERRKELDRIILALEVIKLAWDQPEASASHTDMLLERYHDAVREGHTELVGGTVHAKNNNATINIDTQDTETPPEKKPEDSKPKAPNELSGAEQASDEKAAPLSQSTRRFTPPKRENETALLICTIGNDLIKSLDREPTKIELIDEICNRFNISVLQDGAGNKYIVLPGDEKITLRALKARCNEYLK